MIPKDFCKDDSDNDDSDNDDSDDENCYKKSNRFGTNFFQMMQSSFMPINEPNFDSSYVLDFGDTLQLQLIGQKNINEMLSIERDGSVNVPEIGKIFISGLSLDNASSVIKNRIKNAYIGVEAFVTLVNVRDIQVLVTGLSNFPGIYTLNGNSNILHALSMSGGISDLGSYRKIDLIRNDEVMYSLDLYDVFINGKAAFSDRLRSGDSIVIRPNYSLITASGALNRPGVYELKPSENFLDLYNYANGFNVAANKESLRIMRSDKLAISFIDIESLDDLSAIYPSPGDVLDVTEYERKSVRISGRVNRPGEYNLSQGETLFSLINKAKGYKEDAYPFGGVLNNKKTRKINEDAAEKLYRTFINRMITKGDALFESNSLPFILDELKKSPISGRVMAEFDINIIESSPELDTYLEDGDQIIIPPITQQVFIYGEVNNSGTVRYKPNQTLEEYLSQVGGVLESGDDKNIYTIHPNGQVNRLSSSKRLSFLDDGGNAIPIYPGTVIYVPRKIITKDPLLAASIWAPILSALAVSITSLSVLSTN